MVRLLLKQNLRSLDKEPVLILSMLRVLVTQLVKDIGDKVGNHQNGFYTRFFMQ
jgi:hypothetical protein